jgi:hypothetical protein
LAASRETSNGPDWTDIASALSDIEEFHRVQLTLVVWLPRPGRKGMLEARLTADKLTGESGERPHSVSRSVPIYGGDQMMVAATIFRLVYDVDRDCGAMWSQEELFK